MKPLAFVASRIRLEEKLLLQALARRGVPVEVLDTRTIVFRLGQDGPGPDRLGQDGPGQDRPGQNRPGYAGAVNREISHTRSVYAVRLLEHAGVTVVNSSHVLGVCGDKLLTTLALIDAGLPVPSCLVTLVPEAAVEPLEEFGYPAVTKPLTGSWGRLAALITDRTSARAVLEHRAALPNPVQQITYVQQYVDKPGRDIKGYVIGGEVAGVVYRCAGSDWRTNTARGAWVERCPLDDELESLLIGAGKAVGDGVLGVDVLEDRDGRRYVNEVNHTPEFHGAMSILGTSLVDRYVDYVLRRIAAC